MGYCKETTPGGGQQENCDGHRSLERKILGQMEVCCFQCCCYIWDGKEWTWEEEEWTWDGEEWTWDGEDCADFGFIMTGSRGPCMTEQNFTLRFCQVLYCLLLW